MWSHSRQYYSIVEVGGLIPAKQYYSIVEVCGLIPAKQYYSIVEVSHSCQAVL